jgi:DNA-binding NarL/FixJ family response regulator
MIRVLLVDDHEAILVGLSRVLDDSEGFAVVGCAREGDEAVRLVGDLQPDVVVMDLSMGDVDGVSTIERVLRTDPAARIIVLSSQGRPTKVDEALRAGACGFLVKGEPAATVRAAVRQAHDGERPLSSSLLPGLRRLGQV